MLLVSQMLLLTTDTKSANWLGGLKFILVNVLTRLALFLRGFFAESLYWNTFGFHTFCTMLWMSQPNSIYRVAGSLSIFNNNLINFEVITASVRWAGNERILMKIKKVQFWFEHRGFPKNLYLDFFNCKYKKEKWFPDFFYLSNTGSALGWFFCDCQNVWHNWTYFWLFDFLQLLRDPRFKYVFDILTWYLHAFLK